jgi:hypothetical protein
MKSKIQIFLMFLMLSGLSFNAGAAEKNANREQAQQVRVMEIKQRVEDIRAMDLSHLNATDKKAMKQELRGMNKELRHMEPYVVISVGALVLIIILLIILL